jgi:hypothetical protein
MTKNTFLLSGLLLSAIVITSFKTIDKNKFVCVSDYSILNSTSNKTITYTYLGANWVSTIPPYNSYWPEYSYWGYIAPGIQYHFISNASDPNFQFCTPENTIFFTCQMDTDLSFQGTIEMYFDGILVKTVTETVSSTHHSLVYKVPYNCKTVLIVLHD